jgi:hypothetical protein
VRANAARSRGGVACLPSSNQQRAFSVGGAIRSSDPTLSSSDWPRPESSRISFNGDTGTMFSFASAIERKLASWPSFAGFAFHGLL